MNELGYELSSKNISESYEDLLFREAMAIYCEEESRKITAEKDDFDYAEREKRLKEINAIISSQKRKESAEKLLYYAKKALVAAAVMFFVVAFSLSSVVVASASAREYIRETFYNLLYEEKGGYTKVEVAPNDDFIDPQLYDWAGAFAPTYMTEGFVFSNVYSMEGQHTVTYCKGDSYISIVQSANGSAKLNTENAVTSDITIGESRGLLVRNEDWSCVIWSVGNVMISVSGTATYNELVNIANGIKIIN